MMCGPPIAVTMNGMVKNGPTPTMPMMLVAVACSRPMPRSSVTTAARGLRPGDRRGDRAPLVLLHPGEQRPDRRGHRPDVQRQCAIGVDQARHFDDVAVE